MEEAAAQKDYEELMAESAGKRQTDAKTLVEKYQLRKDARASEIESIQKAKAVLSGADYDALLQVGTRTSRFLHSDENQKCAEDEKRRVQLLQSLTVLANDANEACVEMCKQIGAYPKCDCPKFEPPDATPGVVTWDELYAMFDQLKDSGREMLKKYSKLA